MCHEKEIGHLTSPPSPLLQLLLLLLLLLLPVSCLFLLLPLCNGRLCLVSSSAPPAFILALTRPLSPVPPRCFPKPLGFFLSIQAVTSGSAFTPYQHSTRSHCLLTAGFCCLAVQVERNVTRLLFGPSDLETLFATPLPTCF